MKRLIPFLFLGAAMQANAQTIYPNNIAGCVARYDFTSNGVSTILPDVSANGSDGIKHDMTPAPGWRGIANHAMQFNGTSSYALVPHNSLISPQNFTVVALVRFDGFYSGTCQGNEIVSKGYPNNIPGNYTLHITDQRFDMDCNAFTPTQEMIASYTGTSTYPLTPMTPPVQVGKWYFMASTFDGVQTKTYQVVMDTASQNMNVQPLWTANNSSGGIGTNTQDLAIGRHLDPNYPYWLNGALDEVAIFNRGLNTTEIQQVYNFLWNGAATGIAGVGAAPATIVSNISNHKLALHTIDATPVGDVAIYNLSGQKILAETILTSSSVLDLQLMPQQILFAKVLHKGVVSTIKLPNL